ncbi:MULTISPECIES: hypothetical protein [unclassified Synechocystis]|uniref:hypothetical protein n=1 Tax=unclassified Synechocystis TaxID=2640012 RepID=UPI0003FCA723|nr:MULTISPECIES: hypothetical protein [unclassified Synechocystis]AIE73864.1 hypothetical protein D082_13360 [Synechocystis sp. PCC 6714]MCT0252325.1 hypothetical protein [Synechocystis sp. CS-94]
MFFDYPNYDRLFAQKIAGAVGSVISQALGDHSFFTGGSEIPYTFIERTELGVPWAKNWTEQCFESD